MAENKHLKYFKVENFKCFESFEMDDIGQFNLIVGDNNVGKTSVLEALLFDEDVATLNRSFQDIIRSRNNYSKTDPPVIDISDFILNWKKKEREIRYSVKLSDIKMNYTLTLKKVKDISPEELVLLRRNPYWDLPQLKDEIKNLDNTILVWSENQILKEVIDHKHFLQRGDGYFPLIYLKSIYGDDLSMMFSRQLKDDKNLTKSLVTNLNRFTNGVENISTNNSIFPDTTLVMLDLNNISNQVPLSSQGEGSIKFLRILLEMQEVKGNRLMIDEIDSGIHYSRLKAFWKGVLQVAYSNENNVQLFMTTHSSECIKYFKEALEELGEEYQNRSRHFLLKKTKDGNTIARKFSFGQFQHALENENEIRN